MRPTAVTTRRHLRAATQGDLDFPRTRTVTFGSRAFAVSGPICWNALLPSLKSPWLKPGQFCSLLKTTLMAHNINSQMQTLSVALVNKHYACKLTHRTAAAAAATAVK